VNAFMLFAGVDVLLLVLNIAMIRKNERILREIRRCNHDLALALTLAAQARYREAETAARGWAGRMRAHMAGEAYRPPQPPAEEWQSRFAP
jgi:hypothetical protein